jgi:hypothetical protein
MKRIKSYLLIGLSVLVLGSCDEEYLDTTPTDAVAKDVIFETTQGAEVAMNGIYRWMYSWDQLGNGRHDDWGYRTLGLKADLMGHDMKVYSRGYGWFISDYNYRGRGEVTDNSTASISYNFNYDIIYNANVIIDEIDGVAGDQSERDWLKAQALTVRAHAYLWLAQYHANTYAGNESDPCVPLKLESSEEHMPIASVGEVYDAIVKDLEDAIALFSSSGIERPAKSYVDVKVAQGILARAALIMEDWTTAISMAQAARKDYNLMSEEEMTGGFNDFSVGEWMWGFDINDEQSTVYASWFSHMDPLRLSYASLGLQKQIPRYLYDTIPDTDIRKQLFVAPGDTTVIGDLGVVPELVSTKFNTPTWAADYIMMRAAEMYLIEAEAAAEAGQDGVARTAVNAILEARDPGSSTASSGDALLQEIRLQRRLELWGEGFGLFDIKRWKIPLDRRDHDPTLCLTTDLEANSYLFNWRVPQYEIDANDVITDADQID